MPHLAHVITLAPTPAQERHFRQAAGCARLAWNWALEHWKQAYQAGGKPNWMALQKDFISRVDSDYPFLREVPSAVYYQPFRHLHQAYQRFFAHQAAYPSFKSRQRTPATFKVGKVKCTSQHVVIPLIGKVRLREAPRFSGRIISATISADADRWVISILYDLPAAEVSISHPPIREVVGIDLGLKALATCSDGTQVTGMRPLRKHQKRLKRLNRRLSRCQPGSRRRAVVRRRLSRLHRRIRNIRQASLHGFTTQVVRDHRTIVIEDLNVSGMLKNHCLARSIADAGWGELRRQLTYKCVRYGRTLLTAGRFFPSSKTCSSCHQVLASMPLSQRVFMCPHCGLHLDRDINAAINLSTLAERGNHARGEPTAIVLQGNPQHDPARLIANHGVVRTAKKRCETLS